MPSRGLCITAYSPAFSKGALIYGAQIMSGQITSAHIKDGTVVAAEIAAGAVTSAKLGTGAVTNTKLGATSVTSAKIRAAWLSGTIVSGRTTRAIAHGLGVRPKSVIVTPILTLAQANISATAVAIDVVLAAASAATSTNFYVIGTQAANAAVKYAAYVQL
jgi:hypothetical protein